MAWGSLVRGVKGAFPFPLLVVMLISAATSVLGTMLPPRLSSRQSTVQVAEGQEGFVLECDKEYGDDPVTYRWIKDHQIVTGVLGYAYRSYNKVFLALHPIEQQHAGTYVCEASNTMGVHSAAIRLIVDRSDSRHQPRQHEQPHTDEILSDIATSLSDVLAEGECKCDTMFLLHVSTDAPEETITAQANLIYTIADQMISQTNRVSVMTYSDYTSVKLPFGKGTDSCALRDAFADLTHDKWTTRLGPVLRDTVKKFRKSSSRCKVLFLPIFGSLGAEGVDRVEAQHLRKMGVKVFILEVTPTPLEGVREIASTRGDGHPYHWHVPQHIWPTIVMNMKYISEEMVGCLPEHVDIPGKCVSEQGVCTNDTMCRGMGYGCEDGHCIPMECNINPQKPGCCREESPINHYWCGDVTGQCTGPNTICDGTVQCMNGADEGRCWSSPCPRDKIARCQTSTLCLDLMDLCNGEPACPGGEDEDPRFCRSFPCPRDRSFRCRSGKCITQESLCDGVFRDCAEGDDEVFEFCKSVHVCPLTRPFKCDYGVCKPEQMVCDGIYNCLDATDELVCEQRNCPADRSFKCLSGLCISMDKVCNGLRDGCEDGSDEANCTAIMCPPDRSFKCANGRCLDDGLHCDGRDDCGDGSDEMSCPTPSPPPLPATPPPIASCPRNKFRCNNGACIPESRVCDGRKNCLEAEDEANCAQKECPSERSHRCKDGTCVTSLAPCNNVKDCADGSDEINCTHTDLDEYPDLDTKEYVYEDYDTEVETAKPLPTTTTPTTSAITPKLKPREEEKEKTVLENELGNEEETFIEEAPEEMPTELEKPEEDFENENDIEAAETMLEGGEPAASSEQGAGGSSSLLPTVTTTFIATPILLLSFHQFWMR